MEQRTAPRCPDCHQRIRRNESHVQFYQRWGRCHDCQAAVRQRAIDELRDTVTDIRQLANEDEAMLAASALPAWRIPHIRVPDMLRLLVTHGYRGELLARAFNISAEEIEALTEPNGSDPRACSFCNIDAFDCGDDIVHGLCGDCRAWYSALLPSNQPALATQAALAEARRRRDAERERRMVDDINRIYTLAQAANIPPDELTDRDRPVRDTEERPRRQLRNVRIRQVDSDD